jgi:hypothetical protein
LFDLERSAQFYAKDDRRVAIWLLRILTITAEKAAPAAGDAFP